MGERKPLWSDDRFIAELSEHSSAHKNDWNAALELGRKIINEYEAHLAVVQAESDLYENQAGLLEDNGRLVSWRMVNAEARVKELEQQLAACAQVAGALSRTTEDIVKWRGIVAEMEGATDGDTSLGE